MARLGAVLGGILAELVRARMIADRLSRELVDEYREDPILASMSVPRVLLDQVDLTLRFSVSDLAEVLVAEPDASAVADVWSRHVVTSVLPGVLKGHGLAPDVHSETFELMAGRPASPKVRPPVATIRSALAKDPSAASKAVAEGLLSQWSEISPEIRSKLGTKAAFRKELETALATDLTGLVDRTRELELAKAALESRIDVAVRTDDLPTEAHHVQEFRLTLRGEDLTMIVETEGEVP